MNFRKTIDRLIYWPQPLFDQVNKTLKPGESLNGLMLKLAKDYLEEAETSKTQNNESSGRKKQ